jgi:hypothetical protein
MMDVIMGHRLIGRDGGVQKPYSFGRLETTACRRSDKYYRGEGERDETPAEDLASGVSTNHL